MPGSRCSPPMDVHYGRASQVLEKRERTLRLAWSQHPERFVHGTPKPQPLPKEVWINPPGRDHDTTACSVNLNRRCLNVVDRFRQAERVGAIVLNRSCLVLPRNGNIAELLTSGTRNV